MSKYIHRVFSGAPLNTVKITSLSLTHGWRHLFQVMSHHFQMLIVSPGYVLNLGEWKLAARIEEIY